jgi:tetratricopeptide (TPR) repeat protein
MSSLIARAVALERAGDWIGADRVYAEAFESAAREGRIEPMTEALRRMANVRLRHSGADEAAELADLSAEIATRNGLESAAARARNVQAVIAHSMGHLADAEAIYLDALERAQEANDAETVGIICQNLGVIANIRGDFRQARLLYLETIASCIRSGNRAAAMTAYNNLGMVCADLQEWMEAEVYFARGIDIAQQLGELLMLAKLHVNRAEPLIRVGDYLRASRSLDVAEATAVRLGEPRDLADVKRFRGTLARLLGDRGAAEGFIEEALSIAAASGLDLEHAEALEELARLRLAEGRSGAARVLLREALSRYEAIGAQRDADRLRGDLTSLAGSTAGGDPGEGA